MRNRKAVPKPTGYGRSAPPDGVAYESPADARLDSRMFVAYLAVTGGAFLVLLAQPSAADGWFLQALAYSVGAVFAVVENTGNCSTTSEVRRVFVAVVVLALHITVPIALLVSAWRRRYQDDAEPLKRPRLRDLPELIGAPVLIVLFYWFTFFKLGTPISGAPSFLCWHPGGLWLLFTAQGAMAVAFICVMVSAVRSLAFRRILKATNRPGEQEVVSNITFDTDTHRQCAAGRADKPRPLQFGSRTPRPREFHAQGRERDEEATTQRN